MPSVAEALTHLPSGGVVRSKVGKGDVSAQTTPGRGLDIVDIRAAAVEISLKEEILALFHPTTGPRKLPTLLLYDERGLQLFEDVS